ncbi:hypothetical protein KIAC18_003773 [Sporomusa sphaeroides]
MATAKADVALILLLRKLYFLLGQKILRVKQPLWVVIERIDNYYKTIYI